MSRATKIGLEVHIYVATRAKLHCRCPSDFLAASAPNTQICPRCAGQPGAKPLPANEAAMVASVRLARALGMTLAARTRMLRKHYFYPDSPANFQRTGEPVAIGGSLLEVPLTELHVEEDPGAYDAEAGTVDLNRAGAPLLELVTEPAIVDPAYARRFLQELRLVLSYLDVHREAAGLKVDCNASTDGGARVEVKNVHGARNVERALAAELTRQREALARGDRVVRETRGFDEATGATFPLREKESEADYRHFPDPDLAPVDLAALARRVPGEEAPLDRRTRIAQRARVSVPDAGLLLEERALADAFDLAAPAAEPATVFAFLARDVRAELEWRALRLAKSRVTPAEVASLASALATGALAPQAATRILRAGLDAGNLEALLRGELAHGAPEEDALAEAVQATLSQNPKAVEDFHAGKGGAVHFLVGQAMRRLKGRADANALRAAIEAALRKES